MRGDLPYSTHSHEPEKPSPPRARGSTRFRQVQIENLPVSPACAGIYPPPSPGRCSLAGLPRVRGDLPNVVEDVLAQLDESPPRARGSTSGSGVGIGGVTVSPACAGIYPGALKMERRVGRLPRVRGDLPVSGHLSEPPLPSPPRARGSTADRDHHPVVPSVSPACAGIYPSGSGASSADIGLPRVRGDLPLATTISTVAAESPPRARGSTPG